MIDMWQWQECRDRLEAALNEIIVQDLAASGAGGLYVVLGCESGLQLHGETKALTSPMMGHWLRDAIGDRWKGDGPCFVLNESNHTYSDGLCIDYADANASSIHELSHILTGPKLFLPSELSPRKLKNRAARFINKNEELNTKQLFTPMDRGHDRHFVRIALHLTERMRDRGFQVSVVDLVDWDLYADPGPFYFNRLLRGEIKRLRNKSLRTVNEIEPPKRYSKCWDQLEREMQELEVYRQMD